MTLTTIAQIEAKDTKCLEVGKETQNKFSMIHANLREMEFTYTCPICECEGCNSEECELEIERQEYMAEYWADF